VASQPIVTLCAVHTTTLFCSSAQDMGRLARWMAGRAVGLVLSGGGSRGLAHLGVLHALDDAGIPVDVIGGTSQVSLPAGCRALVERSRHPTAGKLVAKCTSWTACSIHNRHRISVGVLSSNTRRAMCAALSCSAQCSCGDTAWHPLCSIVRPPLTHTA